MANYFIKYFSKGKSTFERFLGPLLKFILCGLVDQIVKKLIDQRSNIISSQLAGWFGASACNEDSHSMPHPDPPILAKFVVARALEYLEVNHEGLYWGVFYVILILF